MSSVLSQQQRQELFVAVGDQQNIARNLADTWIPRESQMSSSEVYPKVAQLMGEYLTGVSDSLRTHADRHLRLVSGAETFNSFLNSQQIDLNTTTALANLASIVFDISPDVDLKPNRSRSAQAEDIGTSPQISFVEPIEASRGRYPGLKKYDARATRPLSKRGPVESQIKDMVSKLPAGCKLVLLDDRIQTGGTLKSLVEVAQNNGASPYAIVVGHSEMPMQSTKTLLPEVVVSAFIYDYETLDEKNEWHNKHAYGAVRLPRADELHDIVSVSPAAGEAVVDRYMEAYPLLKPVYRFLKDKFKILAALCQDGGYISPQGVAFAFDLDKLRGLGVQISDEGRLCSYLSKRVNEFAAILKSIADNRNSSSVDLAQLHKIARTFRWGANDVDYLFSQSYGCLSLTGCPKFNTDKADSKVRYGNFFPYPHRDSLALQVELKERGDMAWAGYSLDELHRTVRLVDQLQVQFGAIDPIHIPALAAPAVRKLMQDRSKHDAVDQLRLLIDILEEQIRSGKITPLV